MNKELLEECIICFDTTDQFIVFACKHKTCEKCYPLIMEQRPNCPLCNQSLLPHTAIQIRVIEPETTCYFTQNKCNLCFYFIVIVILIFFIENNNLN
jgi:hypothetical protein